MAWGGGREGGASRSGPRIRADPGRGTLVAGQRRPVEAVVALPVAACEARVDILHSAPVNASATGVSNRRNPLPGRRLKPDSACGWWCVNTQAWVVIQTV